MQKTRQHTLPDFSLAGQCHVFLPRKNRFCHLLAKNGYCGEHRMNSSKEEEQEEKEKEGEDMKEISSISASAPSTARRIVCPQGCHATLNVKGLQKHIRFHCPFRENVGGGGFFRRGWNVLAFEGILAGGVGIGGEVLDEEKMEEEMKRLDREGEMVKKGMRKLFQETATYFGVVPGVGVGEGSQERIMKKLDLSSRPSTSPIMEGEENLLTSFSKTYLLQEEGGGKEEEVSTHLLETWFPLLFERLLRIHFTLTQQGHLTIPLETKSHDALKERIERCEVGKHAKQQSSLLGYMESLGLLPKMEEGKGVTFMEFGAGSAEFTKWISEAVGPMAYSLLIDRQKAKLKLDRSFKEGNPHLRILQDIKDLQLSRVPQILEGKEGGIAYSKHLCGAATDLTLRCLQRFVEEGGILQGICIALCCHHVTTYNTYINPGFLKGLGVGREDFEMWRMISSWGVCGERGGCEHEGRKEEEVEEMEVKTHWSGLSFEERREMGLRVKRILDVGRMLFLREQMGGNSKLVYFVDSLVSPENCLLLCTF